MITKPGRVSPGVLADTIKKLACLPKGFATDPASSSIRRSVATWSNRSGSARPGRGAPGVRRARPRAGPRTGRPLADPPGAGLAESGVAALAGRARHRAPGGALRRARVRAVRPPPRRVVADGVRPGPGGRGRCRRPRPVRPAGCQPGRGGGDRVRGRAPGPGEPPGVVWRVRARPAAEGPDQRGERRDRVTAGAGTGRLGPERSGLPAGVHHPIPAGRYAGADWTSRSTTSCRRSG